MSDGFTFQQMEALNNLILTEEDQEKDRHFYGSALNPGNLDGSKPKTKDEIAKPNAKIEVKTFNRGAHGGATQEALEERRQEQK